MSDSARGFAAGFGFVLLCVFARTSVAAPVRDIVRHPEVEYWHRALAPIVAIALVAPFVLAPGLVDRVRRVVGWRPVVWIGTVSYGIYLWHQPFLLDTPGDHVAIRRSAATAHGLGYALGAGAVVLLLTVVVAAGSWYGVERPAQRLGRRLGRRSLH